MPGGILLFLLLFLTACSTPPTRTEFIHLTPPFALMLSDDMPEFKGKTNGDLIEYVEELRVWGLECNADKASLQEWSDTYGSED